MTNYQIPALGHQGRELDKDFGESGCKFTKIPTKQIPHNRIAILEQIAERWSNHGYYSTPTRAMAALLGVIE